MARPTRTRGELEQAAIHVRYEVWMLMSVPGRLGALAAEVAPGKLPPDLQVIHNALVESGAVHSRCLFDFLDPPGSEKDTDVVAKDFCPGWQRPQWSVNVTDLRTKAHKCVAHITYDRARYVGQIKAWDFDAIIDGMAPHLARFMRDSTLPLVGSWTGIESELRARGHAP